MKKITNKCVKPDKDLQHGIMEQKVIKHLDTNKEAKANTFVGNLKFTEQERNDVAAVTKKQWQCKQWYVHKRGFITASKSKSVYTRQICVEKHETDVSIIMKSLTETKSYNIKQHVPEDPKNPLETGDLRLGAYILLSSFFLSI